MVLSKINDQHSGGTMEQIPKGSVDAEQYEKLKKRYNENSRGWARAVEQITELQNRLSALHSSPRGQPIENTVEAWKHHAHLLGDLIETQRDTIRGQAITINKLKQRRSK